MKSYTPVMLKLATMLGRSPSKIRKTKNVKFIMDFGYLKFVANFSNN